MMRVRAPSALGSWARTIVRALDARGLDGRRLAMEAGLDPTALEDPDARYPVTATTRLWQLAVEATFRGVRIGGRGVGRRFVGWGRRVGIGASGEDQGEKEGQEMGRSGHRFQLVVNVRISANAAGHKSKIKNGGTGTSGKSGTTPFVNAPIFDF